MNEEIQSMMDNTLKAISLWQDTKTRALADELELKLSVIKLLVGIEKFDQLPAFTRILREATAYIDEDIKASEDFSKVKYDIGCCISEMSKKTQQCYDGISQSLDKMENKLED